MLMSAPASDPPASGVPKWRTVERRALGWFAAAAAVAIAWLAQPLAIGLVLGALMGFTLEPVYRALARRTRRPLLASLVTVVAAGLAIIGAAAGFVSLFVVRAVVLANAARESFGPGGAMSGWTDAGTRWLDRLGFSSENLTDRLRDAAADIASRSAALAGALASITLGSLLNLFFALLMMHLVLLHWQRIVSVVETVSPLRQEYTRTLLAEFWRVGRTTLSGTVVTGLAQGALAALGFWMTGVPQPLFFGIATAIASVVPAVGTLLVWVPAGLFLLATGQPAMAAVELAWGAVVVVGFSDYVVRPRLVGDEAMPTLLTFLALFGGIEVLGLKGLIIGPVVMALAVAILRLYAREAKAGRRAAASLTAR
jgi:predicted PurR-regulated permease PerM